MLMFSPDDTRHSSSLVSPLCCNPLHSHQPESKFIFFLLFFLSLFIVLLQYCLPIVPKLKCIPLDCSTHLTEQCFFVPTLPYTTNFCFFNGNLLHKILCNGNSHKPIFVNPTDNFPMNISLKTIIYNLS